ncbi:MAG: DNA polymerase III subunit gamma/tau [Thermobacillus sp.]|uniref:DNA polymerase III subunit gamma/tau n=1 Tax=Thermobacillus sp. TaxID=2108467 RepID=UPI000E369EDD|nr:DNA polymerase III subunit gamma/tau [Thermobacillus sp.]REK54589.1 MAG: DNA polymerase III subunit gamma/tau [Thermobacillus sp.]
MSHIALYRAWRPQTFQDMVGQHHVIQTLQNAIRENRIAHAYLFNGPRGTGKTSAAKIMAKAVNCEHGPTPDPCNACAACEGIAAGTVLDVIEIDAASNRGIDEIRDIRDKVRYAPTEVRYKVYIIDEVHMLTSEAFNALLKTLEEPPGHVIFILATTEPHKLPATIVSRCQRFDFRPVPLEEQVGRLRRICEEEGIEAEDDALAYIARLSEGGMRDAIGLLEQTAAFTDGRITLDGAVDVTGGIPAERFEELAEAVRGRDAAAVMRVTEALTAAGKSADKCMEDLIVFFRDLLLLKLAPDRTAATERIVDVERFRNAGEGFTAERLFRMIDILNRYQNEMRFAAQPQTMFEVALLKICTLPDDDASDGASGGSGSAETARAPVARESADAAELHQLRRRVEMLEQRIEQLLRSGGGDQPRPAVPSGDGRQGASGGRPAGSFGAQRNAAPAIGRVKLEPYIAARDSEETRKVKARWPEVLQRVKDVRISVHAWLIDGEPVSATGGQVLIAFKNTMHRQTTEKPANREIIEGVMGEVFGAPMRFQTVLLKEWQAAAEGEGERPQPEALELQPEEEQGEQAGRPPWVEEAVKLFGEEFVVVVDDDKT